jgi:acetoin utilization protein AcuB
MLLSRTLMNAKSSQDTPTHRSHPSAIEHFMTPSPHSIGVHQPLSAAHAVMRERRIRHLPVLDGGKLVGLISQRDLYFVETLKDSEPESVEVGEAMSQDIYSVGLQEDVDAVAETMAERRYGCALVVEDGHVRGIFTRSDALRALARLVRGGRKAR